jgi:hypothetical protein
MKLLEEEDLPVPYQTLSFVLWSSQLPVARFVRNVFGRFVNLLQHSKYLALPFPALEHAVLKPEPRCLMDGGGKRNPSMLRSDDRLPTHWDRLKK